MMRHHGGTAIPRVLGAALLSLVLLVGVGTASVEAGECLDRLENQIDACNTITTVFERQLCLFEAGLDYIACLARKFL